MTLKFYCRKYAGRWIQDLRSNKTLLKFKKFAVDFQPFSWRHFNTVWITSKHSHFFTKTSKLDSEISINCGGSSVFSCFSLKSKNRHSFNSKMIRNEGRSTNTKGGRSSSFTRFNQNSLTAPSLPVRGVSLDDDALESLKLPSNPRDSVCLSSKGLTNEPGQNNCFMNCPIQVLRMEILRF